MERDISEFNSAVSYLNRINMLFYIADEAAMGLNASEWFHALRCLYRELSTEMLPPEQEKLNRDLQEALGWLNKNINISKRVGYSLIRPELYNLLDNIEIELRAIMKKSGLLLKVKENPNEVLT